MNEFFFIEPPYIIIYFLLNLFVIFDFPIQGSYNLIIIFGESQKV